MTLVGPLMTRTTMPHVVSVGISETTIVAMNLSRKGLIIWNAGGTLLYLKLGTGVTDSDFTWRLQGHTGWEVPSNYLGIVTGLRGSGTDNVMATELCGMGG